MEDMNAGKVKQKQRERYDEISTRIARGEMGYKPAEKSKYSASPSMKFEVVNGKETKE